MSLEPDRDESAKPDPMTTNRSPRHTYRPGIEEGKPGGAGVAAGAVVILIVAIAVFIVVAQNTRRVEFDFLWFDGRVALAVLLLGTVLLTLLADEVVTWVWRRRRRRQRWLEHRRLE